MTMKIDGHRPAAADAESLRRTEDVRKGDPSADRAGKVQRQTDAVVVSKDAQLMTDALKAVSAAPEVRQDVVDRMRQALAAGELGKDTARLADQLIDRMLEE